MENVGGALAWLGVPEVLAVEGYTYGPVNRGRGSDSITKGNEGWNIEATEQIPICSDRHY